MSTTTHAEKSPALFDAEARMREVIEAHDRRRAELQTLLQHLANRHSALCAKQPSPNDDPQVRQLCRVWNQCMDAERAHGREIFDAGATQRAAAGFHARMRAESERLRAATAAAYQRYTTAFRVLLERRHAERVAAQAEAAEIYDRIATIREELAQLNKQPIVIDCVLDRLRAAHNE
ncbi:MAG TPA: hypothetical protein VMG10_27425 [Gemmataceae bacterium]|nr:hypothetical protein [Gemmataceae bacterium]